MPGAGVGAALGAGLAVGGLLVFVDETAVARAFHHRVGGDVGGNTVGHEGFRQAGAQGVGDRSRHRRQHAGVGILLHHHVLGQPAGLAGQRLQVGPAHRPRRVLSRHRQGQRHHLEDHQHPRRNCQRGLDDSGRSRCQSGSWAARSSVATKWNHADSSSTSRVSPSSAVAKAYCHAGNEFDHGTPKLDTYHQPLTLANDNATRNSTAAANTVRLRLRMHRLSRHRDRGQCSE